MCQTRVWHQHLVYLNAHHEIEIDRKFMQAKAPHHHNHFSNGPSLNAHFSQKDIQMLIIPKAIKA